MMLFTKNSFRILAISLLSTAVLSACGGAGSCSTCAPTPTPGSLTLSIAAPSQYTAGLPTPIEAPLTMTNTSNVNATNLVYTIPAPGAAGNYTGVVITPNAGVGSASGDCTNIAAGASCTFIATISAYANPGSFTVTATPNATVNGQSIKTTQASKALQSSISVTANLGLVDIPNTNNEYYILPSDQTIQGSATSPTTAYVSVLVKVAGEGLNSLKLVDETGKELSYTPVGNPRYTVNSVNSYKITIPAGKTLQQIQALSNVCTTLNSGENNNTACSNNAEVNLASQGSGILAIQPTQFNMSGSYTTQVITLANTGTGDISSIVYPNWASLGQGQFTLSGNNCTNLSKLSAGQSCTITLSYTAGSNSGQITPVFSYDDDNNSGTAPKNTEIVIPYTGTSPSVPFSVLTIQPSSVSLSEASPRRVLTITNTAGGNTAGVTIPEGWTLPSLPSPLELESTNCYAIGGVNTTSATKSLNVGASCTYTIKYSNASAAGQTSLAFTYYNGIASEQVSNVAVDWTSLVIIAPTITITSTPNPVGSVMMGNGFQFTATLSGKGSSTVSADFANPAAGIITSEPSPCALNSVGLDSCTFTIMTAWDTSLTNGLDNLAYQINVSATNSAVLIGNPLNYIELTPTVYLRQTGQTPSTPTVATAGMDGFTHAGIPWAYVTSGTTTPATRFTVGTDAESDCVTDNLTGLMWVKSPSSTNYAWRLGTSPNYTYPAQVAVDAYNANYYCGHNDWYLPTINDLSSLVNEGQANQATWLNTQGFSNVQTGGYWSSTEINSNSNMAWLIDYNAGNIYSSTKANGLYVFPVRIPSGGGGGSD